MRPSTKFAALRVVGLAAALGVGLSGCVSWLDSPRIDTDKATATAQFTRVMNGAYEEEDTAISMLSGAMDRHPDDGYTHLLYALATMHRFIRKGRFLDAVRTTRAFDKAVKLDPADTSAQGWRAFWRYQAARARGGDLAEAQAELLEAGRTDPNFTPFLVAISLAKLPLETGLPQALLQELEGLEDCGDGTAWTCRTGQLFPYGTEGFYATLGDLHVRIGDLDGAKAKYAQALMTRTSTTWPYRSAFQEWVGGAEQRLAALANDDPKDDPEIFFASGDRSCAACHRR